VEPCWFCAATVLNLRLQAAEAEMNFNEVIDRPRNIRLASATDGAAKRNRKCARDAKKAA
jgi:hypothetical protein